MHNWCAIPNKTTVNSLVELICINSYLQCKNYFFSKFGNAA